MKGKLYVVGTPIGNLKDISYRAVETLSTVDFIAAEDTRVTIKLLNRFDINKPLTSYHEHNKLIKGQVICDRIIAGETCALVSDAGMPAISDPGEDLVKLCYDNDIEIEVVPGPSAVISALAISGISSKRFAFEGFLSTDKHKRKKQLEEIALEKRTLILYEAPHKLLSTLDDLYKHLGDRSISLAREITKIHEEVFRTTITNAINFYKDTPPKGEFVLVIEGNLTENAIEYSFDEAVKIARQLISEGKSSNEAAKIAAKETGFKKSDIYKQFFE